MVCNKVSFMCDKLFVIAIYLSQLVPTGLHGWRIVNLAGKGHLNYSLAQHTPYKVQNYS